jgi:hypothetical protein
MRIILTLGVMLWASAAFAQTTTCTSANQAPNTTAINCTNGQSVTVTNVTPAQTMPLPALAVAVPTVTDNFSLYAMAAMAASNRPPTAKQLKKYCKKRPGAHWQKRNLNGMIVAEGDCSK